LRTGTGGIGSLLKGVYLKCVSVSGLVAGCTVKIPDRKSSSCCVAVISPHNKEILNGQKKIALEPLQEENDGNS
jgi:hypothetical protein